MNIFSVKNEMNYPKSTNPFGTPKSTEKDERSREGQAKQKQIFFMKDSSEQ